MKRSTLLYKDSLKNRAAYLLKKMGNPYHYLSPVKCNSGYIEQVAERNGVISYHDGKRWQETEDEQLLYALVINLPNPKDVQQELKTAG